MLFVVGEKYEVIGIAYILPYFEFMLHEMIEFVYVYIHEELTREIPERESDLANTWCWPC